MLEGCLLGCAVGDSICLPYEGLSPRRVDRLLKFPLSHRFVFGRGMVSDDTDHSVFVCQSLLGERSDSAGFAKLLASRLKRWLVCLPAGIGFATLRSCLRLLFGASPSRSGVFSAGNGAAMRSAPIGIIFFDDERKRREFVSAATRVTHSDPKAEAGAQVIAAIVSFLVSEKREPTIGELERLFRAAGNPEGWDRVVERTIFACRSRSLGEAIAAGNETKGVGGYVYDTIPVAVAAWFLHAGDFRKMIETIASLGGDTDTVAAIAGSLAGTLRGRAGIPVDWIDGIVDRPHGPRYLSRLAQGFGSDSEVKAEFSWLLFPRGMVFTAVVLAHGLRRMLPPY